MTTFQGREVPLSLRAGHEVINDEEWASLRCLCSLSDRELAIAQLVFDDQSDAVMGVRLGISRHTVNTYLRRLYRKLNVHSRPQLIVSLLSHCMLDEVRNHCPFGTCPSIRPVPRSSDA